MHFLENSAASAEDTPALVSDAYETALFIRENVAQTVMNERGNYEMTVQKEHVREGAEPPPLPLDLDVNKSAPCATRASGSWRPK